MKKVVFFIGLVVSADIFGMFNNYQNHPRNEYDKNQYSRLNRHYEDDLDQHKTWSGDGNIEYNYEDCFDEFEEFHTLKKKLKEYEEQNALLIQENRQLKESEKQSTVTKELLQILSKLDNQKTNESQEREREERKFFKAIKEGDLSCIEKSANLSLVKAVDIDGNTPIHVAINAQRFETVWYLINKFEECTNLRNKKGETPLLLALKKGYIEKSAINCLFISKNVDVNISDEEGISPILLCINNGDFNNAWKLIIKGARVDNIKKEDINKKRDFHLSN